VGLELLSQGALSSSEQLVIQGQLVRPADTSSAGDAAAGSPATGPATAAAGSPNATDAGPAPPRSRSSGRRKQQLAAAAAAEVAAEAAAEAAVQHHVATPVTTWVVDYGEEPCLWVVSQHAWYKLLSPSRPYAQVYAGTLRWVALSRAAKQQLDAAASRQDPAALVAVAAAAAGSHPQQDGQEEMGGADAGGSKGAGAGGQAGGATAGAAGTGGAEVEPEARHFAEAQVEALLEVRALCIAACSSLHSQAGAPGTCWVVGSVQLRITWDRDCCLWEGGDAEGWHDEEGEKYVLTPVPAARSGACLPLRCPDFMGPACASAQPFFLTSCKQVLPHMHAALLASRRRAATPTLCSPAQHKFGRKSSRVAAARRISARELLSGRAAGLKRKAPGEDREGTPTVEGAAAKKRRVLAGAPP
jgi:hypothetical protein